MVCLRILFVLLTGLAMAAAQGTVNFTTRSGGSVNAPVYHVDGRLVEGTGEQAVLGQLYAGPVGSPSFLFSPVGTPVPFRSDAGRGYITAGGEVTIPETTPGGSVDVMLVAWFASQGNSLEEVWSQPPYCGGWGMSPVITVNGLGSPGGQPALLAGLQGFTVWPICPEPSIGSLIVLGLGLMMFVRGHRRSETGVLRTAGAAMGCGSSRAARRDATNGRHDNNKN